MERPITVGVDGSPGSLAAADWAAVEATRRGLPLRLVHAWITEPLYVPPTPDETAARALLDRVARDLVERHPAPPDIATEVITDVATNGLIHAAAGAEMLVLGTRGHGALVGFLLGSVGLPVIAHARRPVVLVRASATERAPGEESEEPDEIVVGVKDAGPAAQALLDFAFTAAMARGATVRAVRAWGTPSLFSAEVPGSLEENAGAARDLETVEGRVLTEVLAPWRERFPGARVIEHPGYGNAAETLLSAAAPRGALVVVGRRVHRRTLGMRIGPVTHAALHHARSPVAVVPYHGENDDDG
ncbi:universal stress protein [Streptomyces radicis]|uniref:Universal stress protein n=1 Tax=Streptomyces radicis TaxID=1750517 RepID=A0A3A9WF98_9ACTN|nr:universal stress protein [Streptomyces radicis]RKN11981.1 universal stress protein [Streptomyces radicis]RKN25968.1 universal stress protein [Streptomyces radicis]